jgi:quercetin dioxygenase-like cupin family protein
MQILKTRWSKVYESSEEELVALLRSRGIATTHWSAAEFEELPERTLPADTTIWLAEGSATFRIDGKNYSMQPGDTIHLPADTTLAITAGMSGCICYESPMKA